MRPFGYENDRTTVREQEAELLREAARRIIDGDSLRSIVNDWHERGVKTPGGNAFQPNVLRRVLTMPRVVGKIRVHDDKLAPADWPAILDEPTWAAAVKAIEDRSRNRNVDSPANRVYLLTGGLAHCGLCGSPLIARPNNDGKKSYVCTSGPPYHGCGKIRITAEPFEGDVVERVLAQLLRVDARRMLGGAIGAAQDEAAEAERRLKDAEERLAELSADYTDGSISRSDLESSRQRYAEIAKDAKRVIRRGRTVTQVAPLQAESLVEWWEAAPLEDQRTLVDTLAESITVGPAITRGSKIYDRDRVTVKWRSSVVDFGAGK